MGNGQNCDSYDYLSAEVPSLLGKNAHNLSTMTRQQLLLIRNQTVYTELCGLVDRVPGYRSRCPGSIPGATRLSEKYWVWNGVHSASRVLLRSYLEEKVTAPV
jgi:hypothetical protein